MTSKPKIENVLPLSPVQEGMVFHAAYDSEGPDVYNVQIALDLEGELDAARLRDAAATLLERHMALRSSFRKRPSGESMQVVQSQARLVWHETGPVTKEEAQQITETDRDLRFDLTTAPLIRFTLIQHTPTHHQLLLTNHHIILDGWSMPLLLQELLTLYRTHSNTTTLPTPTPHTTYYAWRQQQNKTTAQHAWKQTLQHLQQPTLLAPQHTTTPTTPRQHTTTIPNPTPHAQRHGITPNTLIQTTWALTLARHTNTTDITFGTTTAGRPPELPGTETMIGLYINTIPIRITLHPNETPHTLLNRIHNEQANLTPHHHLSLTHIHHTTPHPQLFDTLTIFENYPLDKEALDRANSGLDFRVTDVSTYNTTHYPLTLFIIPGEEFTLQFHYRPELFTAEQIQDIADRYTRILHALTHADPNQPIHTIDGLAPQEREQVLTTWNDTARALPTVSIFEQFAAQAARNPQKTAITLGAESVTYQELIDRATAFAGSLSERGIGPEDLVALAVPRSPEMVVALLGVLKAGAAYLPIDPEYPADRIELMLTDAAPALLVTTDAVTARLPRSAGIPLALLPHSPTEV